MNDYSYKEQVCTQKCNYRKNLCVMKCKNDTVSQVQRVSHDSHVNTHFLTNKETEERLRNVQKEKKILMMKNSKLQQKLQKLIEKDGVTLTCTESDEILSLMSETSPDVTKFPQDSFQSIL